MSEKQQRHLELADYFSGTWASADKPYSEALSKCVQRERFFPGEAAADRNVPHQPIVLEGDIFNPDSMVKLKLTQTYRRFLRSVSGDAPLPPWLAYNAEQHILTQKTHHRHIQCFSTAAVWEWGQGK